MEAMHGRFEIDWRLIERTPEYQGYFNSEFGKAWKTRTAAKR